MKKLIAILLLGLFLILSLVGCYVFDSNHETTPETTIENTTPEPQPEQTTPALPDAPNPSIFPPDDGLLDGNAKEFVADILESNIALSSWMSKLLIQVNNNQIFLNNIQYENATFVTDLQISYQEYLSRLTLSEKEYIPQIVAKMEGTSKGYWLESTSTKHLAKQKVAVYYIDNTYYFVYTYSGSAIGIFYYHCNPVVNEDADNEIVFGSNHTSTQKNLTKHRHYLQMKIQKQQPIFCKTVRY